MISGQPAKNVVRTDIAAAMHRQNLVRLGPEDSQRIVTHSPFEAVITLIGSTQPYVPKQNWRMPRPPRY